MNFEEIRDRKLKIITTQNITVTSNGISIQSAAFNSATKVIMIRSFSTYASWVNFKIGANPTADYMDFYIGSYKDSEILTFNVEPGQKISARAGNEECRFSIIELGY